MTISMGNGERSPIFRRYQIRFVIRVYTRFLTAQGTLFQETPGKYLDGSRPVLMSFTSGWFSLSGLQGYQRAYYFLMLATYYTPHKLSMGIAYDYNPAVVQNLLVGPTNFTGPFGSDNPYGSSVSYGGVSQVEQWRIFFAQQRCQAFQITITETFDATLASTPGAGLSISGLDLIFGQKKGFAHISSANSAGVNLWLQKMINT